MGAWAHNGTRHQGLRHMFEQYNIIHIITSLALDNDVANVWILAVVWKCGDDAHMFDKVCGSVFPRESGTDWPIKSGTCVY